MRVISEALQTHRAEAMVGRCLNKKERNIAVRIQACFSPGIPCGVTGERKTGGMGDVPPPDKQTKLTTKAPR